MLAGDLDGEKIDLHNVFEAVGAALTGKISEEELDRIEACACPGCGSCAGLFTANSMNCLTEVAGPGTAGQRHHSRGPRGAHQAGARDRPPRRRAGAGRRSSPAISSMTRAVNNALAVDSSMGCSTNTALHLAAIAHEAGVGFEPGRGQRDHCADAASVLAEPGRRPSYGRPAPGRRRSGADEDAAGRGQARRLGHDRFRPRHWPNSWRTPGYAIPRSSVRSITPITRPEAWRSLFGNLAPNGAVVKESAVLPEMLQHTGTGDGLRVEQELVEAHRGRGRSSPAASSSSATRAPRAARGCRRC